MKRCLDEQPEARGTFEDVGKDLSVHQSKYGGKQAHQLEEQIVRHPLTLLIVVLRSYINAHTALICIHWPYYSKM